jgi:3-oxoadipate enol-lactonase
MLTTRTRSAIGRLATALLSVRPLVEAVAVPMRVIPAIRDGISAPGTWSAGDLETLGRLVDRVAPRAGVAGLTVAPDLTPDDLQVFERVVSARLGLDDLAGLAGPVAVALDDSRAEIDAVADEAVADSFDVVFGKETITAFDGIPLSAYASGAGDEAVILIPACGMPAELAESWMRFLARDRRVLTWETRAVLGAADYHGDYNVDVAAQAADLFTVMDHYNVGRAHVIGLCGGAVIALAAAADRPGRISSLSLWYGAYEFAGGSQRTKFQNDLIELMAIAARSPAGARSVQGAFCQVALTNAPAEIAHFVLYPYANAELFYRYCRINGHLACTDVGQYLARIDQPALVVTSQDDQTAHPQGSRQVADGLRHGRLRIEPPLDHVSLFRADDTLLQVAVDFMERTEPR